MRVVTCPTTPIARLFPMLKRRIIYDDEFNEKKYTLIFLFFGPHASPQICPASVDGSPTSLRKRNDLCLSNTHIRSPSWKITIHDYFNHRLIMKPTLTPRERRSRYLMDC